MKYFCFALFALILNACSQNSNSGSSNGQVSASSAASKNIDLSVPAPAQSAAIATLYDETFMNLPNFAVFQRDPRLADLFSPQQESNLCFPSAFAQGLVQLFAYHAPPLRNLLLPGLSADQQELDPSQLVRSLAGRCKTDPVQGSFPVNELNCVISELHDSGYTNSDVSMINANQYPDSDGLPIQLRSPTVDDFRHYLSTGYTVLLGVGWYKYDTKTSTWSRTGGHALSVVGYGYNQSWQQSQVVLKIVNPNLSYSQNGTTLLSDTVTMLQTIDKPGVNYPQATNFTLVGNGFASSNFVEEMIVYLPK